MVAFFCYLTSKWQDVTLSALLINHFCDGAITEHVSDFTAIACTEVAEKLNIGYEAVSRMERGIVMPTVERLVELAEIFGCEAADLLTQSSNRIEDQSAQIKSLLSILEDSDRVFLLDLITKLVERLKNQK